MVTITVRGLVVSALVDVPMGFRKWEVTLIFQRYIITDAKRQGTASVKVKTKLC